MSGAWCCDTVVSKGVGKVVQTGYRVTEESYEWVRRRAFELRVSQSALIEQAIGLLRAKAAADEIPPGWVQLAPGIKVTG